MTRITTTSLNLALGLALAALVTASASAQGTTTKPAYKRDVPAKLARQAKISEDSARTIAMSKIPNGTVQALELENEKGKLMYSFELKVAGKDGIEEVNVNALDGSVVAVEHESSKTEAKEAKTEARAKKAGTMKKAGTIKKPASKDTTRTP